MAEERELNTAIFPSRKKQDEEKAKKRLLALAGQWETHMVNLVMGNISLPILTYKTIYRAVFDVTAIFLIVLAT